MQLRKCRETDLPACAQVLIAAYRQPPYNEEWQLDHAMAYLQRFYQFDPEICFVVLYEEKIVGAIFAYRYPWQGGENCCIQELFVSPSCQRMSAGKHLMEALAEAKQGSGSWLVANQNASAVDFYQSLGFSSKGPYEFFYGPI